MTLFWASLNVVDILKAVSMYELPIFLRIGKILF